MDRHQAGPAEPFGSYMFSSWMKQGFAFQPKKRAFGCKSTSAKLQVGQVEVGREPGTWPAPHPYPKLGNSTTGTWSPCWPPKNPHDGDPPDGAFLHRLSCGAAQPPPAGCAPGGALWGAWWCCQPPTAPQQSIPCKGHPLPCAQPVAAAVSPSRDAPTPFPRLLLVLAGI